ncbi:hypothetical protein [Actinotalea sp. Marseille-Q4924]|nr:hypothetical protein [Actinotalea sp. Marseille-Q4924]
MSATRCTCILDGLLAQLVVDPTCPATLVHLTRHDVAVRRAR